MRLVVLVVALAGCLPVTQDTVVNSTRTVEPSVPGPPGDLVVRTKSYGGLVVVTVGWPRQCRRQVIDHVATRRTTSARLAGTGDGAMWGYFVFGPLLVLAWPIGIADVAITLGVVGLSGSPTRTERTNAGTFTTPCFLPARRAAIQLTLPSGDSTNGVTDDHGQFALVGLGDDQVGDLVVTSGTLKPPVDAGAPAAEIDLAPMPAQPTRAGISAVSYAAVGCAAALGMDGVAKLELEIGADGGVTRITTDRGDPLAQCLTDRLATTRFPATRAPHTISIPLLLKRPR